MVISNKLKQRFCKDCNIPISVYDEPYFSDRLELYDKFYESKEKWNVFLKELEKYNCEQDYFEEYNRVKDAAINAIKESEGFSKFNSDDMNNFSVKYKNLPSKDIYKEANVEKLFISIDMKKANFSALWHYDSSIFGESKTWEEFIEKYTTNKHIINSKYIRQVILGNCNPRRQVRYEKYLMEQVLEFLFSSLWYRIEDIVFFSNDEIIINMEEFINQRINSNVTNLKLKEHFDIPFNVELFYLRKINGTDGYYKEIIKTVEAREYKIKCLNSYMLPFVMRKLQNQEITENDKVFIHEGFLSKFIEVPEIKL